VHDVSGVYFGLFLVADMFSFVSMRRHQSRDWLGRSSHKWLL